MFGQFVRTALLCAVLGGGLYLALITFAEGAPKAHLWLTLLIAGSASIILALQIVSALARGQTAVAKGSTVSRAREPRAFYGWIGFWSVCLVALIALFLWAVAGLTPLLT